MKNVSWLSVIATALLLGALVAALGLLSRPDGSVSWGEGLIVVALAGVGAAVLSLREDR